MPESSALAALAAVAVLAAMPACTGACPKDKLDAGAAFVAEVCALEPIGSPVYLRPGARWATVDKAATATVADGTPLFLYADHAHYDNHPYVLPAAADELRTRLAEDFEKATEIGERSGRTSTPRVLLAIADDVPVDAIPPLTDLVYKSGFTELAFLAEAGAGPKLPALPAPEVEAEIAALAASFPDALIPDRAAMHELAKAEAARCPALTDDFINVSGPYEDRCARLGRDVIAACEACRCSADVLRALSLAMTPMLRTNILVDRTATQAPDATPVPARPGERWSDLAPRLFAAPGPAVRLELTP